MVLKGVSRIIGSKVTKEKITPVASPRLSLRTKENVSGYLFISPSVILFFIFILVPFFYSFYLSLHKWQGGKIGNLAFAGFSQYSKALQSPEFWHSILITGYYTFATVLLQILFGLILAIILNQKVIGRTMLRTAYFVPVVMSTIVVGIVWRWIFSPDKVGLLNYFLSFFHIQPVHWLTDPKWAMPAIIIMSTWKWVGYHMVIFLAGLQDIPQELYESASIEGANGWQKFHYITLPMLAKTTWFLVITSIINSFQVFDQIYVMTGGGPLEATNVIVYYIYKWAFQFYDMGYASAVAWLLFFVIFVVTLIQMRFTRSDWHA